MFNPFPRTVVPPGGCSWLVPLLFMGVMGGQTNHRAVQRSHGMTLPGLFIKIEPSISSKYCTFLFIYKAALSRFLCLFYRKFLNFMLFCFFSITLKWNSKHSQNVALNSVNRNYTAVGFSLSHDILSVDPASKNPFIILLPVTTPFIGW